MKQIAIYTHPRSLVRIPVLLIVGIGWLVLLYLTSADVVRWGIANIPQLALVGFVGIAVYLLPGLAILRWLWPDVRLAWTERIAMACGIGVALPSLALEVAYILRMPWSTPLTIVYVLIAVVALMWRQSWRTLVPHQLPTISTHSLLFGWMITLAFLARLYIVRGLPVGMWGDAYHHTMIAQLLVDNGGLFTSWQPYAPLRTFTYHFGFHADAVFFHWFSGIEVARSLVYTGQLLSVATLPVMYVFARRLSGSDTIALWSMVLVGFVNTQPIYYVNWGRYTQLAGQVVLPVLLVCWMVVLEAKERPWRPIALAAMMTAALALIHYIVVLFAILFLSAYLTALIVREPRPSLVRELMLRSLAIVVPAFVLASPWLWNTLNGYLLQIANNFVAQKAASDYIAERAALQSVAPFYVKTWLIPCAVGGVILALAQRRWRMLLLVVWGQLLIVLVVPQVVGLPGAGIVVWFTVYIALYLVALPLAAYPFGLSQMRLEQRHPRLASTAASLLLLAMTLWGVRWQQSLLAPANQLFGPADEPAMAWIRNNTAPDALFLVNMIPAYGDSLIAGTDGGWWIPLLTQRRSTLPPITYGSEQAEDANYAERVNGFAAALREHPLPSEEGIRLCREAGVDYIYVGGGAHTGQTNAFAINTFRNHPAFQIVYERDGIAIVALN